jgi:hypothetical protein
MNKAEAIELFKSIQNGRGTGDLRSKFLENFGAGKLAINLWDDEIFTLGVEYGILVAFMLAFDLKKEDL